MTTTTAAVRGPRLPLAGLGMLLLIGVTQLVIVLEASVMTLALPAIADALVLSTGQLTWVLTAYALTFGGLLLTGGGLTDRFGVRRTLLLGLSAFALASLVGGLGGSFAVLVAARAAQGAGAALLAPATLAAIVLAFPAGTERRRAFAVWGVATAAGAPIGGLAGGVLVGLLGWRATLLVNIPVCVAALLVCRAVAPRARPTAPPRLDLLTALAGTAGIGALLLAVSDAPHAGWASPRTTATAVAGTIALALFAARERRAGAPLIPWPLVRRSPIGPATAIVWGGTAGGYGMAFVLTLHVQQTLGWSALEAGLALLPFGVTTIAGARFAAPAATRWSPRGVSLTGLALVAAGLAPLTLVPDHGGYLSHILPALLLIAVGDGLFVVAINMIGLEGLPPARAGVAGGMLNAAQQLGGACGLALTVAAWQLVAAAGGGTLHAAHAAFAADLLLTLLALAAAWSLLPRQRVAAAADR